MKIDVEGMEMDVLQGAQNLITKFRPPIYLEYAKNDPQKLARVLRELDYTIFVFSALDWIAVPRENSFIWIKGLATFDA